VTRLIDWSRWFAISSLPSIRSPNFSCIGGVEKIINVKNLDVRNITSLILSLASLCVLGEELCGIKARFTLGVRAQIFWGPTLSIFGFLFATSLLINARTLAPKVTNCVPECYGILFFSLGVNTMP
jgi:hypothetical protein